MSKPVGQLIRSIAARICDAETMERVIDPTLADLRLECDDATRRRRPWTRRWLRFTVSIALVQAVAMSTGDRLWRIGRAAPDTDEGTLGAMLVTSSFATAAVLTLGMLPGLLQMPRLDWRLAVYLVPQGGSIAIPIGLTFGVLAGLRRAHPSNQTIRKLLTIAITCCVASFISSGWIVPNTNQAFRELAFRQVLQQRHEDVRRVSLARGLNELTLVELKQRMRTTLPRDLSGFTYYQRWALSSASVVMVLFALVLMTRWPIGRFGGSIVALSSLFAYLWLSEVSLRCVLDRMWPAVAAAWLPNTVFATFAVVMMVWSVRVKRRGRLA